MSFGKCTHPCNHCHSHFQFILKEALSGPLQWRAHGHDHGPGPPQTSTGPPNVLSRLINAKRVTLRVRMSLTTSLLLVGWKWALRRPLAGNAVVGRLAHKLKGWSAPFSTSGLPGAGSPPQSPGPGPGGALSAVFRSWPCGQAHCPVWSVLFTDTFRAAWAWENLWWQITQIF